MTWLLGFLNGGLLVAITVLAIHDQQNIAALKRMHGRLKQLEEGGRPGYILGVKVPRDDIRR